MEDPLLGGVGITMNFFRGLFPILNLVYERSEFYIVIGARIVEEIEVKAEYMGGLAEIYSNSLVKN